MKQTSSQPTALIIGGGFSGLATASLLAKNGFKVTLLEKNATLGGRARVYQEKGFSFDMGPSWYMMPEVFDRFFAEFGKKPSDYYELIELNPRYKVFFDDQSSVVIGDDQKANKKWLEAQEKGASKKLQSLLKTLKAPYTASVDRLMYADVWNWKTWADTKTIRDVFQLIWNVRLWESWYGFVGRYIESDKIKKILSFSSVFLGGSPMSTPSFYSILLWADFKKGVWYPKKGMGEIVKALETLAREQGVEIITNADVAKLQVSQGKVVGVHTKDTFWPANIVVGAGDLFDLETRLLPPAYRSYPESYWKKKTLSISALLIFLGVRKKIRSAQHHSMYFSKDWAKNFNEIYKEKKLPTDPSFYVSVRSKTDLSLVPDGCEELVILVPLAAQSSVSDEELASYADTVISTFERLVKQPFKDDIIVKKVYGPQNFEADYHAYQGNALGLAHTFLQSLWLRPNNRSKKVAGLYYAGQYTNPGVGVPTALVSAHIVTEMIKNSLPTHNENEKIFKRGSSTYYYSSLFFRGQTKKDVFALYAYVRTIDDYIDAQKPLISAFESMWNETLEAWDGKPVSNRIVREFVELAKRKHFRWEWIAAFWNAMRLDITKKKYHSFQELEEYIHGSAEVIGLMMANILDLPESARKAAALQGKAMQFVNFIRDVEEDKQLGRNYLGYSSKEELDPELWDAFIKKQIEIYQRIQKSAEKGYHFIPKKYLIPIKTAADMYTWTARRIKENPQIVLTKRVKPHKRRVLAQLFYNILTLR